MIRKNKKIKIGQQNRVRKLIGRVQKSLAIEAIVKVGGLVSVVFQLSDLMGIKTGMIYIANHLMM
jgi:hypothetical protein